MILRATRLSATGNNSANRLDSDAADYISVLEAQGINPTFAQRTAINDFVNAEKIALRWSLHRRIYLPVWGNAGANAIDLVTRTSGSFGGGVTHGAGFVQGNGTTGFFDTLNTAAGLGMTAGSGSIGVLIPQVDTGSNIFWGGYNTGAAPRTVIGQGNSSLAFYQHPSISITTSGETATNGIFLGNCNSTTYREIRRRSLTGTSLVGSNTTLDTTNPDSAIRMFFMCRNAAGTASNHSSARFGAFTLGLGFSSSGADAFTLNLQNLWESIVYDGFDADAVAYIRATGASDYTAINAWVVGLKNLGIWNNIVSWPMRSTQNHGTGTVLRSLGGLGQFNGTLTNGPSWTPTGISFDGVNDFVEVPNPQRSTALSAYSIFSVFDSDQTANRTVFGGNGAISSAYGPALLAGGSPLTGASATRINHLGSTNGTSATFYETSITSGNTGVWQTAFAGFSNTEFGLSVNGGTRQTVSTASVTAWNNEVNWRMGARNINLLYFIGQQALNLYANIYLTPAQNVALRNLYVSTLGQGLGLP